MTVLYVSGPMTGYDAFNFPAFDFAAGELRAAGYVVINPTDNWGGATDVPYEQCMRLDLQQVLMSDGLALLDDWDRSRGAKLEVGVAEACGIRVMQWENWVYETRTGE